MRDPFELTREALIKQFERLANNARELANEAKQEADRQTAMAEAYDHARVLASKVPTE